jgi:hypothetical protein
MFGAAFDWKGERAGTAIDQQGWGMYHLRDNEKGRNQGDVMKRTVGNYSSLFYA